jgi:hypothetical protein
VPLPSFRRLRRIRTGIAYKTDRKPMICAHPVAESPTAVAAAAVMRPRDPRLTVAGKGAHGIVRGDSRLDLQ